MTTTATHELIEIDPATGEEDMLVATGSERRMLAMMIDSLVEFAATGDQGKIRYRVQLAS